MIVLQEPTFQETYRSLVDQMLAAPVVITERWQGMDIRNDPAAKSYELQNVAIEVPLRGVENLDHWRQDIGPNLPWADDHFAERVGGEPLNPGEEWRNWPWARSAAHFRDESERFNHTYMERLWPRWARRTPGGMFTPEHPRPVDLGRSGVAWRYGDLDDLVGLLATEPHTRMAWIPLFFPEDTGVGDGGRKPCTLGYHAMVREERAHIYYPLRSCDLVRHFRDDCYLAVRLLLWIIDRCREEDVTRFWKNVVPGAYVMHCISLHVFENDMIQMRRDR